MQSLSKSKKTSIQTPGYVTSSHSQVCRSNIMMVRPDKSDMIVFTSSLVNRSQKYFGGMR